MIHRIYEPPRTQITPLDTESALLSGSGNPPENIVVSDSTVKTQLSLHRQIFGNDAVNAPDLPSKETFRHLSM